MPGRNDGAKSKPGSRGRKGVWIGLDHIGHDLKHGNDGDGDGDDGNRCRMDGATSAARHDAKRVGTDTLAGKQAGKDEDHGYSTSEVPRPSTHPSKHSRQAMEYFRWLRC